MMDKTVERELGEIQAKLDAMHIDIQDIGKLETRINTIEKSISYMKGGAAAALVVFGFIEAVVLKVIHFN